MNKNPTWFLHRLPEAPHTTMAKSASKCLFLFFLSFLFSCSSGTLVGFSYHVSGNTTTSSPSRTISFLKRNKIAPSQIRVFVEDHRILRTLSNTGVAVDLYLNEALVQNIINSKSSSISGLKSYIMPFLSQVKIKSIVATSGDYTRKYALSVLLSTLKSIHSVLSSLPADRRIKVSVAFPLSFLENMSTSHGRDLHRICDYITQVKSAVIVEANIDGELSMGESFVHSMIERASLANSLLPCTDVPMVLTVKSPAVPSATEVAAFADKVSKALETNTHIISSIVGLYAQVSSMEDFAHKEMKRAEEQIFPSFRRVLSRIFHLKTTLHEADDSPTIFPTTPISTTPPVSTTPYIPTPTIVTVPSTNTVPIAPLNPIPSTTPITVPSTNPADSPVPEANPTTAPPITVPGNPVITNPVTTYPAPAGVVPVTTPVTNPVAPPATSTNAPAVPGQSWCVAKSGASETAVQAALDYACGKVDCSQLQQGGSCYNPTTLQNHASYAFNSYYQKNPVATSCDFGGVATIVTTNPSIGSCTYLSSSSSSSTPTTPSPPASTTPSPPASSTPSPPVSTTPTPLPATTTPPAPTFTSFPPPGEGVSGSGTPPPSVLNSSNPAASGTMPPFGLDSPPSLNTTYSSTSSSASLRPFVSYIFLATALVTRKIVLNM
ncbi:putative glucan endo-1,3-beta-D-glucosidase [Rosa chinensis]|uniref:Putative glucan endo-1,3-beta-D-glucosidase n=1 Tax=Rosa chinensis TaxID=74649 RepID=A0A2P6R7T9_ROSCH|nr:rho GTPase-activating protein gacQ [Rosa chinensis]PRQ42504.1 putative glucan endo-1,3-beta-D-glucosidase [Rosa chinensis]